MPVEVVYVEQAQQGVVHLVGAAGDGHYECLACEIQCGANQGAARGGVGEYVGHEGDGVHRVRRCVCLQERLGVAADVGSVAAADVSHQLVAGVPANLQLGIEGAQLTCESGHAYYAALRSAGHGTYPFAAREELLVAHVHAVGDALMFHGSQRGQAASHVVVAAHNLRYHAPGFLSLRGEQAGLVGAGKHLQSTTVAICGPVAARTVAAVVAYVERLVALGYGRFRGGCHLVGVQHHAAAERVLGNVGHQPRVFLLRRRHQASQRKYGNKQDSFHSTTKI